eukprot:CAMPEP_0117492984 /NCGR_PEP_ID=MMETSP0784-20121206/18867_1 /TAXON_ID=39447 /ORGANISM="" /LENGTH=340 /DNA_ID=CAMNT_0005287829 /DNA_START=116 /DNA_END=1138 /DNA_ORIENTATION=-
MSRMCFFLLCVMLQAPAAEGAAAMTAHVRRHRHHREVSRATALMRADAPLPGGGAADKAVPQSLLELPLDEQQPGRGPAFLAGGGSLDAGALDQATASAEAIAAAAEKEAAQKEDQDPGEKVSATRVEESSSKADEDAGDDNDEDEDEEGEDDQEAEQTSSPCPEQQLESLIPQGEVAKILKMLRDNLRKQAELEALTPGLKNKTAFESRVDAEASSVAVQTDSSALGKFLATMRKEMWQFASPFYLKHLEQQQQALKAAEAKLKADLQAAQAALGNTTANISESRLRGAATDEVLAPGKVTVPAHFSEQSLEKTERSEATAPAGCVARILAIALAACVF